jgi:hypothetical protein
MIEARVPVRVSNLDFESNFLIYSQNEESKRRIFFKKEDVDGIVWVKGFLSLRHFEEEVVLDIRSDSDFSSLKSMIPFLRRIEDILSEAGKKTIVKFNSLMEEVLL